MTTTFDRAMAVTYAAFPGSRAFLAEVRDVVSLQDMLTQLEQAELRASEAYDKLRSARRDRIDRRSDYVVYTKLQDELFRAQAVVVEVIRRVAGPLAPTIGSMLPVPRPLPALTWESAHAAQTDARALRGGLGVAPLLIVGGIIAVLVALGLMYLLSDEIGDMVDELSTVLLARARAEQQTELLAARRSAMAACIARGGSQDECMREAAALAPTPREAGTEVPEPPSRRGSSALSTLMWVGVGTVVVFGLGTGLYFAVARPRRYGPGYYGMGGVFNNVRVRSTGALPARVADLDGRKSRFFLEV